MPVINGGWEVVDKYDDLRVGDIVKYTDDIKAFFKSIGAQRENAQYVITLLYRNSKERFINMNAINGKSSRSFPLSDDMELRAAPGIKTLERKTK